MFSDPGIKGLNEKPVRKKLLIDHNIKRQPKLSRSILVPPGLCKPNSIKLLHVNIQYSGTFVTKTYLISEYLLFATVPHSRINEHFPHVDVISV
jgi:hypothetical protein